MRIYIAGGAVRDLLLGRTNRDKDYLVLDADKNDFLHAFPHAKEVGKAFPVFLDQGREFSFPREKSMEKELVARDLTINAIALGPDGDLICHPMALDDIKNRVLRPASDDSIIHDPLRIFRAARFWAAMPEFSVHPTLVSAMRDAARKGMLQGIVADRIGSEIRKALNSKKPGNFLRLLHKGKSLHPWFAELGNDIEKTARLMDTLTGNPETVWAGLCHALQKQDRKGLSPAYTLGTRLRMPTKYVTVGEKGAAHLRKALEYFNLSPADKVDLLMALHTSGTFPHVFALAEAVGGLDMMCRAQKDLATILRVKLPPEEQNLGPHSGRKLRSLRSRALQKK